MADGRMEEDGPRLADPLFAETRLARDGQARKSVVVVGLPRSGSSFLSHVLSQIPGWYVFDDLLFRRQVADVRATVTMSDRKLERLIDFLGWQVWARLKHGQYSVPNADRSEIPGMKAALYATFAGKNLTWLDLQEEWLVRLSARSGCLNWGFKSPHESRHIDELFTAYPDMKAIFIMRAPEKVLASYKHMPVDSGDGHPDNYHPVTHAYIWKRAADSFAKASARYPGRLMLVRFEELVADPAEVAKAISRFLGTPAPETVSVPPRPNTSFSGGRVMGLTGFEHRLAHAIIGGRRAELGFPEPSGRVPVSAGDLGDLTATTARFTRRRTGLLAKSLRSRLAWSR